MKAAITLTAAALALTACTATPEMIAAQKVRCAQVGHAPGTTEHALCVERGTMQQQQTQNAVAGSAAAVAINSALIDAIF
jgi:starvation-inducible outer membrane lipoprotein